MIYLFQFSRALRYFLSLITSIILISIDSIAADDLVELPPEELARESVLPVFDKPIMVKNRNVSQEQRLEAGLYYGWAMSEPIFNVNKLGLAGYYHFNEDHALGLIYAKNFAGLSNYANQLHDQFSLDFNRAPYPEYSILADYNFNAYYGKISLTKRGVINTMTLLTGTGGITKYIHKMYPVIAMGIGEKFFLNAHWSLRLDLRLHIYQGPVPFLAKRMNESDKVPAYTEFSERMNYTTNLDVGVNYLF